MELPDNYVYLQCQRMVEFVFIEQNTEIKVFRSLADFWFIIKTGYTLYLPSNNNP